LLDQSALPGVVAGGALDADHIAGGIAYEMGGGQHPDFAAILVPQAGFAADDMAAVGLHAREEIVTLALRAIQVGAGGRALSSTRVAQQTHHRARGTDDDADWSVR
jgi:hypothetical protein